MDAIINICGTKWKRRSVYFSFKKEKKRIPSNPLSNATAPLDTASSASFYNITFDQRKTTSGYLPSKGGYMPNGFESNNLIHQVHTHLEG